jgi:hypothetical protein
MVTPCCYEVLTWTLFPGVDLVAHRFGHVVAVYYQLGTRAGASIETTVRTWHAEELVEQRRISGLALSFGEG